MKISKLFLTAILALSLFIVACNKDNDDPVIEDDEEEELYDVIVGNWRAPIVAPVLVELADSIHVEFRDNQSYLVKSFKDGVPIELKGTYSTSDGVGNIRNIVLEQSEPTALTSEGIFEVDGDVLTYEVAQTEPEQTGVTAPTADEGFGSTSGGAFGDMNIQVYYKMEDE